MTSSKRSYCISNLLDLVGSAYGIATCLAVIVFALSGMDTRGFAKCVTVLLFVIGSLLLVDGTLSVRTKIDRTWGITRTGLAACVIGLSKIGAGVAALLLVAVGISL